jgi:DnaJ-class molecular chaperone
MGKTYKDLEDEKDQRWRKKGGPHRTFNYLPNICRHCEGLGTNVEGDICEYCDGTGTYYESDS